MLPALAEAAPADVGSLSKIYPWPCVAIHTTLLPNGKVLCWADDDSEYPIQKADFTKTFIVTIASGGGPLTNVYVPNNFTDMFCAGHALLPDGRLIVLGGHEGTVFYGSTDVNLFETRADGTYAWTRTNKPMFGGRWYASALTLGNGEVLVVSGTKTDRTTFNMLPQVWQTNSGGGWRSLLEAQGRISTYPKLFPMPDGRVLIASPAVGTTILNTSGSGSLATGPSHVVNIKRFEGIGVCYDPGKWMLAGGGDSPTSTVETIDLNVSPLKWKQARSMRFARRYGSGVVLPDGKVFVSGGTRLPGNTEPGAVLTCELWDPTTGDWTSLPNLSVPRLYHSVALLIPDGRVLITGGGRGNGGTSYPNAQFYSPPYLFRGTRPTITSAPATVIRGKTFSLGTTGAVDALRIIKLGSMTHSTNMSQATGRLPVTRSGSVVTTSVSYSADLIPPGHYMLFALQGEVPSVASIIRLI